MLQWGPVCIFGFWWRLLVGATSFWLWPGRASQSTTSLPSLASPSQSPTSDLDMQQNATECNNQLVYTLYTSLLLCLWNLHNLRDLLTWFYVIFRGTHELSWYSYWRMHLFHSFSDVEPCWAMSSGLGESMSVASMTGTGGTLAEKTLELRRDGVPTASCRRAGVFQGRFRNFKGLAKGLDEDGKRMKRSEQYFQLLMRRHLYTCIQLYTPVCFHSNAITFRMARQLCFARAFPQ